LRELFLYSAISLDFFQAKRDGNLDFTNMVKMELRQDYLFSEMYHRMDTILMGKNTYNFIRQAIDSWEYPDSTTYVFTTEDRSETKFEKENNIKLVNGDVFSFVSSLKEKEGKDIWLMGGSKINNILVDLIDRMILTLFPLTLGDGLPLFSKKEIKFKLISSRTYTDSVIVLEYIKK